MALSRILPYLFSCIWLSVPVLIFDGLFTARLPAPFQPENFLRDIPPAIGLVENATRIGVFALMLLMPLGHWRDKAPGLALYAVGLAAYGLAWLPPLVAPDAAWNATIPGFLAAAYTPALWLVGIGLVGERRLVRGMPLVQWSYFVLVAAFVLSHCAHTLVVYWRYH